MTRSIHSGGRISPEARPWKRTDEETVLDRMLDVNFRAAFHLLPVPCIPVNAYAARSASSIAADRQPHSRRAPADARRLFRLEGRALVSLVRTDRARRKGRWHFTANVILPGHDGHARPIAPRVPNGADPSPNGSAAGKGRKRSSFYLASPGGLSGFRRDDSDLRRRSVDSGDGSAHRRRSRRLRWPSACMFGALVRRRSRVGRFDRGGAQNGPRVSRPDLFRVPLPSGPSCCLAKAQAACDRSWRMTRPLRRRHRAIVWLVLEHPAARSASPLSLWSRRDAPRGNPGVRSGSSFR